MRVSDTKTLSGALRELAAQIQSPDDLPALAIREAAQRIDDLAALATEMSGMLAHDKPLRRCASRAVEQTGRGIDGLEPGWIAVPGKPIDELRRLLSSLPDG